MPNYGNLAKNLGKFINKNSPVILTSMAVAGVLSTTVLAVRATPQAMDLMTEAQAEKGDDLTKPEVIKATWLCYVPAASMGLVTIACIVGGTTISTRRNAALISLYTLTENGWREYQDQVVATVGKEKEEKIRSDVMRERMKRDPEASAEVIILDGESKVLCYDSISGRYFKSNMESMRRAENDINQRILLSQNYASLNEFWRAIGLPITGFGDEVGWTTDTLLNIQFSTTMDETNTKPCIAVDYRTWPIQGYYQSFLG